MRLRLYRTAVTSFATRGFEATTLRDIAKEAGVTAPLLYRYFPSKRAVVLALYDDLSGEYASRATMMASGPWRTRFLFALRTSLEVLGRQRGALTALTPVLVGDTQDGLFAPSTAESRRRVQSVFVDAVREAADAPAPADAEALGRLLHLAHLGVILWWLLDRSPGQRATAALIATLEGVLPVASLTLRLAPARRFVRAVDALYRDGLLRDADAPGA